ncbi:hypothetical protein G7Z17_g7540 [Cylindrodendrum hubeiense]|uniref:Uncharacterized protein n=1 Tax=Cylindrodendrum hubeiense TaxID=595255 RepID=A0A9P5L9U0_9HYPO|nr:hypothetical protein G7Z17_g7540 [Cylindrodendrum hubeiense]
MAARMRRREAGQKRFLGGGSANGDSGIVGGPTLDEIELQKCLQAGDGCTRRELELLLFLKAANEPRHLQNGARRAVAIGLFPMILGILGVILACLGIIPGTHGGAEWPNRRRRIEKRARALRIDRTADTGRPGEGGEGPEGAADL